MIENESDQENGDDESYVHQFDETYSALDDLLVEINEVDDQIEHEPTIARELAKAKKAISTAANHRMALLKCEAVDA